MLGYCLIAERRAVLFSVWFRGPLCTVEVWLIFVMTIDAISSLVALLVQQDSSKSSCEGMGGSTEQKMHEK